MKRALNILPLVLGFAILPILALGQITITGSVFNEKNNLPIPFATIGLVNENTGINANEDGRFRLNNPSQKLNDTLILSSVGYKTKKIAISIYSDTQINISLAEELIPLAEVRLAPNYKWAISTLNEFRDCGNYFVTSNGYLQQIAQPFRMPKKKGRLLEVKICTEKSKLPDRKFRIRVYDMDSLTGGPGTDLCTELIEVTTKGEAIIQNMKTFNIEIPGKEFFIGIEWLKISENERKLKGPENKLISNPKVYYPMVAWREFTDNSFTEGWELNYNGTWQPLSQTFKRKKALYVSAKVEY